MSAPLRPSLPPRLLPTPHIPSRRRHVPLPTPRVFSRPSSSHSRPPITPSRSPLLPPRCPSPGAPRPAPSRPLPAPPPPRVPPSPPEPPGAPRPAPSGRSRSAAPAAPRPPRPALFLPGGGRCRLHSPPTRGARVGPGRTPGHGWGGGTRRQSQPDSGDTPEEPTAGNRARVAGAEGHSGHGHPGHGQGDSGVTGTRARGGHRHARVHGGTRGGHGRTAGHGGNMGRAGGTERQGGVGDTDTRGAIGHTGTARAGRRDTAGPRETRNREHRGGVPGGPGAPRPCPGTVATPPPGWARPLCLATPPRGKGRAERAPSPPAARPPPPPRPSGAANQR